MYLPNRALDLVDMFRARVRAGPGIAVDARLTDYAAFYFGTHDTVWIGLPGPRSAMEDPKPWGRENLKGIVFFGVDATDNTPHHPRYSVSEATLGFQLLVLGADVGFDPVELGDFLAGLVFLDPKGDDL